MGQDESCGICGKHYQGCKHRLKEHFANEFGTPLCGTGGDIYVHLGSDTDPDDVWVRCKKSILSTGTKDFGKFMFILGLNA